MTAHQTPPPEAGFFATIRGWGLTRSDARVISGVGGGIAERLGWSRGWVRVGLVAIAILLNGIGLLAYAAAWALLPDRQGRIIVQDFGRGVPNVGALIGIGVIALFGFIRLVDGSDPWGWGWDAAFGNGIVGGLPGGLIRVIGVLLAILIPILLIGGAIFLIVYFARRNRPGGAWGNGPYGGTAGPGGTQEPPVYATPPAWAAERRRTRAEYARQASEYARQAGDDGRQAAEEARASVDEVMGDVRRTTAEASQNWKDTTPEYVANPWQHQQGSWQQTHQPWQQQAAPPAPPVPPAASQPRPQPPHKPRVPGPGGGFWLLTLAWMVLAAAGVAWAEWDGRLVVNPIAAWFVLFVTGLGVILALIAFTGRRLGFLGFASVVLAIPALVIIAESDHIREDWLDTYLPEVEIVTDADGVTRIEVGGGEVVIGSSPDTSMTAEALFSDIDAIAAFEEDYARIALPGGCYASDVAPEPSGLSQGFANHTDLDASVTETVTTGYTTVRVPAGASVEVIPDEMTSGTVYWTARDLTCDVWMDQGVTLANPDTPTLTLELSNPTDGHAVVVIEEVAP